MRMPTLAYGFYKLIRDLFLPKGVRCDYFFVFISEIEDFSYSDAALVFTCLLAVSEEAVVRVSLDPMSVLIDHIPSCI